MSGVEGSRVRTSRLPTREREGASRGIAAASSLRSPRLSRGTCRHMSSLKTSLGSSTAVRGRISRLSSERWANSGMSAHGGFWMQNISERHKGGAGSSLSQVLETKAPLRYFLTPEQLRRYLRRMQTRSGGLPSGVTASIKSQIAYLSSMGASAESQARGRRPKAGGPTARRGLSTLGEAPTLFARRMLPSECERLQGFPKDWTLIGTGQ